MNFVLTHLESSRMGFISIWSPRISHRIFYIILKASVLKMDISLRQKFHLRVCAFPLHRMFHLEYVLCAVSNIWIRSSYFPIFHGTRQRLSRNLPNYQVLEMLVQAITSKFFRNSPHHGRTTMIHSRMP